MTPLAWQIRAAMEEGALLKFWRDEQEFARKVDIKYATLLSYTCGYVTNEAILRDVLAKANGALAEAKSKKSPKEVDSRITTIRNLYLEGIRQGKWKTMYQCAEKIHAHGQSLSALLKGTVNPGSTPRRESYAAQIIERLQGKIKTKKKIEAASETDQGSSARPSITDDGVIVSPLFDRILKGEVALEDQVTKDGTFVLKASNFRCLRGKLTQEQVLDTNEGLILLADELTRRVQIINQIEDTNHRIEAMRGLNAAIDRLYTAIEEGLDVSQSAAARNRKRLKDL